MNIYDIAREAGVSIATISRVFNGKSVVSAKTREKVEAVLKKYNYTPDIAARGLVTKSTMTVAVIAENIGEYTAGLISVIQAGLSSHGYGVLLFFKNGRSTFDLIKEALRHRTDAIVLIGGEDDRSYEKSASLLSETAKSLPVAAINCFSGVEGVHSVLCDLMYGMMLAVSHLVENGRRDIIFVQGGGICGQKLFEEGFAGGLAMNDLMVSAQPVPASPGFAGGFACAQALLEEKLPFNGVVCDDDAVAAGFIKCLEQHSVEIPYQIAVVGFYNTSASLSCSPGITTVDCQTESTGKCAVHLLNSLLSGENPEKCEVLVPRLIIRNSSV